MQGVFLESLGSPSGAFHETSTLGDNRATIEYVQSAKGGDTLGKIACVQYAACNLWVAVGVTFSNYESYWYWTNIQFVLHSDKNV